MNMSNMKMININMKKHLELRKKLLPEMLTVIILHLLKTKIRVMLLMMAMEHQLELKVTIQPQELLKKSTVLLVSMRGTRVDFPSLLWKENKDLELEQLLMEMLVAKTPKCVLEGPWISVCLCARVSLPGCTGPVCRAVRTGAGSEEQQHHVIVTSF